MADITKITYLSPEKLAYYDGLIKNYINAKDDAVKELITAEETARKAADSTNAQATEEAKGLAEAAQDAVDTLAGKVGTVPENKTVMDVIDEKTAGIATDAALGELQESVDDIDGRLAGVEADYLKAADKKELQDQITENVEAIETLNGDSSVEGSVDKKVADAINTFATQITDDGTINTYKEVLNYIATHTGEASEMMTAIETLEGLVGSKSVATQIAEAITAENLGQYATDEELADAIARIVVLEGKTHEHTNKTVLDGISETKVANWDEAYTKAHEHANASVLNGITADNVTAWNNAAPQTALDEVADKVTALETANAEGGAVATAIAEAKKAGTDAQAEVDALEGVVAGKADAQTVTDLSNAVGTPDEGKTVVGMVSDVASRVEALEAVEHAEIETSYIDGLFAEATA